MRHLKAFTLALLTAVALTGCPSTNPIKPAVDSGRPELVAYALEGSYTIVQGKALEVARDPAAPAGVVAAIQRIDARANPILDDLKPVAKEAERVRQEVADCGGAPACDTKEARLAALLSQLNGFLTRVSPLITELVDAIKGGAP